jgi:hypothetical protein
VLVVTPPAAGGDRPPPVLVEATVAAVPRNLAEIVGSAEAGQGMVALAVEVSPAYVGVVGEAEAVSVGVLDRSAPFPGAQATPRPNDGTEAAGATATTTVGGAAVPVTNLDGPTTIPAPAPTTTGAPG